DRHPGVGPVRPRVLERGSGPGIPPVRARGRSMTVEKLRRIVEELPPELYSKVRSAKVRGNDLRLLTGIDDLASLAKHIHGAHQAPLVTMHATDDRAAEDCFKLYVVLSPQGIDAYVTIIAPLEPRSQ